MFPHYPFPFQLQRVHQISFIHQHFQSINLVVWDFCWSQRATFPPEKWENLSPLDKEIWKAKFHVWTRTPCGISDVKHWHVGVMDLLGNQGWVPPHQHFYTKEK